MTIVEEPTIAATGDATAGGRAVGLRGWWQRQRTLVLIVVGLVAAVAVVVWSGTESTSPIPLDPDNPAPAGAQALARVLDDEGVDITVARSADELEDTELDGRTAVVVTSTNSLGESTIQRLRDHVGAAPLILVDPGLGVVDEFGLDEFPSAPPLGDGLEADCANPLLDGLELEVDSALAYGGTEGCFEVDGGSVVLERDGVTFFGAGEALSNDQILRADNAAVALRVLGQQDRLVWYIPSFEDLQGADGVTASSLLPTWIRPGLWLGAIVLIGLVVWRARRLGPLASEPLPVVVKAIETTRSRGRLYRKAGDRTHAAAALRSAARTRAAERLRLGAGHDEAALIRDVARHTGRMESEVAAALASGAPPPASDRDLVTLATELAELDREVRRT